MMKTKTGLKALLMLAVVIVIAAPSPPLTNVTGTIYNDAGLPAPGTKVTFTTLAPQTSGSVEIAPTTFSAIADGSGAISVQLPRGIKVNLTIGRGTAIVATVPDQATVDLSSLLAAGSLPPPAGNVVSALSIMPGGDYGLSVNNPAGQGIATLTLGQTTHFSLGVDSSAGGHKITDLAAGTALNDAMAWGQGNAGLNGLVGVGSAPKVDGMSLNGVLNVKAYGAAGSTQTATCSGSAGSGTLTCPGGIADFAVGHGIIVPGGGAANTMATPSAPSVTNTSYGWPEVGTIGSGAVTVIHAANFIADFGIEAAATSGSIKQGTPYTKVGSSPGSGQYSVDPATGIYTFNAGDNGKTVNITYSWNDTTGAAAHSYQCAAFKADGSMSAASAVTTNTTANAALTPANFNRIVCGSVTGASGYAFWKDNSFIGSTGGTQFDDLGTIVQSLPYWMPSSPPVSAQAGLLSGQTVANASGTTITLAGTLTSAVTNVAVRHDDTLAFNTALSAANAANGGIVEAPAGTYNANPTIPPGVLLRGAKPYVGGNGTTPPPGTTLTSIRPGLATVQSSGAFHASMSVRNLMLVGFGAGGLGDIGVSLIGDAGSVVEDVQAFHYGDQCIKLDANSIVEYINRNGGGNCLLDRNRTTHEGALEAGGVDHSITNNEFTASVSTEAKALSPNLYVAACVVNGGTQRWVNNVCETSEVGFYNNNGTNLIVADTRADLNYGHGWWIHGGSGEYANNLSLSNSKDTSGRFDGLHVETGSATNQFSNFRFLAQGSNHRYHVWDATGGLSNQNYYSNIAFLGGASTANVFTMSTSGSASFQPWRARNNLGATTAQPDVSSGNIYRANNTGAFTVTWFANGVPGQHIWILGDGFTTIQNSASNNAIKTKTAANELLLTNEIYEFENGDGGVWTEVGAQRLSDLAAATGDYSMGNHKLTSLATATASGDALSYGNNATIANLTVTGTCSGCGGSGSLPGGATAGQFLLENATANAAVWASISGDASNSTGTPGQLTVNHFTLGSNAAAGGFKITGIGAGTVSGDALAFGLNHLNDLASATADYSMGTHRITGLAAGTSSGDAFARSLNTINETGSPTADFSMNSHKMTGLSAATATGDALSRGNTALVTDLTATRIIEPPNVQTISTGTGTISFATGDFQKVTLASSPTITLSGATTGQNLIVKLVQDATGGRVVTWSAGSDTIAWINGTAPTLTTTPSKADVIGFVYDNGTYSQTGFAPNETP